MTQSARQEEVHYCARCRAIIADEESAGAGEVAPGEAAPGEVAPGEVAPGEVVHELEAKKDRDSGVMRTEARTEPQTEAAPSPAPENELRAAPRRQVEVDVGIHSDSHFFAGITGDVSRGGLFVATYANVAVGSKITLDFELPNGRILVNGTVRWLRSARDHHSPGFGVQFDDVEPAMMKLIERFCQARPPLYYDQADDF